MAEKALFIENLVDTEDIRGEKKNLSKPKGRSKIQPLENLYIFYFSYEFYVSSLIYLHKRSYP